MPDGKPASRLVLEYEEVMLGKRKEFSADLADFATNETIGGLLRYVFVDILGWPPDRCQNKINKEVLSKYRLMRPVRLVKYPKWLDRDRDYFYLASLIYPEEISYSRRDCVLMVYTQTLNGKRQRLPRGFFSEEDGRQALLMCLRYAAQTGTMSQGAREQLLYFTDTAQANQLLIRMRLQKYVARLGVRPVDLLYEALPPSDETDFWYHYAKFVAEWNEKNPDGRIEVGR